MKRVFIGIILIAFVGSDAGLGLSAASGQAPAYALPGAVPGGVQGPNGSVVPGPTAPGAAPAMPTMPGAAPGMPGVPGMPGLQGTTPDGSLKPEVPALSRQPQRAPQAAPPNPCFSNAGPQTAALPPVPPSRIAEGAGVQVSPVGAGAAPVAQVNVVQGPVAAPAQSPAPAPGGEPSRIEAGFNADLSQFRSSAGGLSQFGYAIFASSASTFAPVDDIPVGPDYVLGPGDDLAINVWGAVDSTIVRTVDRNGRIVLPKVGDLRVWGLTFSQADRLIREQLARYFRGFQTSVTMGRLRTVRVHVVGEVCQPGAYTLSSLATVTNALYSAGGPTKLGSLRDVRLLRGGYQVGRLDLYDFLLRGDRTRDYRLESGDTIFVPTIGAVVAIAGEVKRPAIYELANTTRLADLVQMAGGVTPVSYLRRVQIVRSQPSAERVTRDYDLSQFYLKGDEASNPPVNAGDLVLIHRSDPRVYNVVKIEGAVKYPGQYELKPLTRISQLLPADMLAPEAYSERVEVARRGPDLALEIIPVNLKKAWADKDADLLLKPLDEITVRSELRPAQTVTFTGQVVRPGVYPIKEGERLSSVIERAGGFTDRAYLKGAVFTREALRRIEREQLEGFIRIQEQRMLAAASTTIVGAEKEEVQSQQAALQARRELLRALTARVPLGRMVVRLDAPERLKGTPDDVILVGGDALDVPAPPSSVLVLGAVRNSGSVLYKDGAGAEYYVNRVGGLSKEADKDEIHIVKADGSALAGFTSIRTIEPGDSIIVPPKQEEKIRALPTIRDVVQTVGSALLSFAALAVLF